MKTYNARSQRASWMADIFCLTAVIACIFASSNHAIAKDVVVQADGEPWVIRVTAKGEATASAASNDIQFAAFQDASGTELPPPPAALVPNSEGLEVDNLDASSGSDDKPMNSEGETPPLMTDESSAYEVPADCPPVMASRYLGVYASIPFLRSEYLANPSYRHEATMEILFGQLRPTVVHKYQPQTVAPGSYDIEYVQPYRYYRYGRRVNYNFWYPGPSIRRGYRSY